MQIASAAPAPRFVCLSRRTVRQRRWRSHTRSVIHLARAGRHCSGAIGQARAGRAELAKRKCAAAAACWPVVRKRPPAPVSSVQQFEIVNLAPAAGRPCPRSRKTNAAGRHDGSRDAQQLAACLRLGSPTTSAKGIRPPLSSFGEGAPTGPAACWRGSNWLGKRRELAKNAWSCRRIARAA